MLSIVMVSGLLLGSIGSEAFAGKNDNNGNNGCDNSKDKGNGKAQACNKNPNSGSGECDLEDDLADCDGDGIANGVDFCPEVDVSPNVPSATDWDGDGIANDDEASESDKCDPA